MKLLYKLLSCVSKAMDRKYVKKVLQAVDLDDDLEKALDVIEHLRDLYKKKLDKQTGKYAKRASNYIERLNEDVDEHLRKKLGEMGINIDELLEKKNKKLAKMGLLKREEVLKTLDEVDRVSQLKDELLLVRIEEAAALMKDIKKNYTQVKADYRKQFEKMLTEQKDNMEQAVRAQIEEEAIAKFLAANKRQNLRTGVKTGKIVRRR